MAPRCTASGVTRQTGKREELRLIESAKLCGVEPKAYLLRALRAALATPGTVTLPHTLAP